MTKLGHFSVVFDICRVLCILNDVIESKKILEKKLKIFKKLGNFVFDFFFKICFLYDLDRRA